MSLPAIGPDQPDQFIDGWHSRTITLRPDGAGAGVATLIDAPPPANPRADRAAVLYLHGFTDFFFHPHHAQHWTDAGYAFHALDLRDHGRSVRQGRRPGWVPDVALHAEEVTTALRALRSEGAGKVVLLGHSTGALVGALIADRHPELIDALVLNSPWLDLNRPTLPRIFLRPVIGALGSVAPDLPLSKLDDVYGRSLHTSTGGEFDYDLSLKPLFSFPVRAGWLASVLAAQRIVRRGLDITAPILVCTSGRSGHLTKPAPADISTTDIVLRVDDMHRLAPHLGPFVQINAYQGGRHDLALSAEPIRTQYATDAVRWADKQLADQQPGTQARAAPA